MLIPSSQGLVPENLLIQGLKPGNDFLQANKEYYDQLGEKFDEDPDAISLAQRCARAMLSVHEFKESEMVVMDFACGTGLISRELRPYVKSILGVDISQGMVDQYNRRAQNEGISAEKMRAVREELEGKEGELGGMKFDVIVCASAYHHFESIGQVTRRLTYFLKPGGFILVTDFQHLDDSLLEDVHRKVVVHTQGIDEVKLRHAFEEAGLELVTYETAFDIELKGTSATQFIAKGTKPL